MLLRRSYGLLQRNSSVLVSLIKLRSQHAREGGGSSMSHQRAASAAVKASGGSRANGSDDISGGSSELSRNTVSSKKFSASENRTTSPRSLLPYEVAHAEAQKILQKSIRSQESLTDVHPNSSTYCVEVGKLLAVSAHFGCSTTTPRVADALQWVEHSGAQYLTTLRQIMSIVTPLMKLADGREVGAKFFWLHLYPLVEKALQSVLLIPSGAASYEERMHSRAAIVSIFLFVSNSLGKVIESVDTEKESHTPEGVALFSSVSEGHLPHIISLLELSTRALSVVALGKSNNSIVVMDLSECVAALSGICALEQHMNSQISLHSKEKGAELCASAVLPSLYSTWIKHLQAFSVSLAQQAGNIKPVTLQNLGQLALVVPNRIISLQFLQYVLQFMPSAFPCCSLKELCSLTQLVNKLHMKFGSKYVTSIAVQKAMEACRPKIVLLSESTTFRHVESSILIGSLSRWEDFADGGSREHRDGKGDAFQREKCLPFILSNELLDLLCHHFASHMDLVLMYHMIPFLQGLSRVETYRQNLRSSSCPHNSHILLKELHLEAYLEQCMERVIFLAREKKCNAYEAGSALKAFVELGIDAQRLFWCVESILYSSLTESSGDLSEFQVASSDDGNTVPPQEPNGFSAATPNTIPSSYLPVMKAVELFSREIPQDTVEGKKTFEGAQRMLKSLHQKAPLYLSHLSSPNELISFFPTLVSGPSRKEVETEASTAIEQQDGCSVFPTMSKSCNVEAIQAFLSQVEKIGEECSVSELAMLSLGIAQVSKFHPSLSIDAMNTLMNRLEVLHQTSPATETEVKKIMDATCKMNYMNSASLLCKVLSKSLVTSACNDLSFSSLTDRKSFTSFHSLSLLAKSAERFCALMPISRAEAVSIKQSICRRAQELLLSLRRIIPSSLNCRAALISELSYLAFCLSRLCIQWSTELVKEEIVDEEEGEKLPALTSIEEGGINREDGEPFIFPLSSNTPITGLQEDVQNVFELLGDVLEGLLNDIEMQENEDDGNDNPSTDPSRGVNIEPQKLVMIIQAFETVSVTHSSLMYAVLFQLQLIAHRLEPLELALVMNASLQQGVWNARVMKRLASEVEKKILHTPLRQCQTILVSLQRSNILSPSTCLLPEGSSHLARDPLEPVGAHSPLETLARAVLQRMVALSCTRENFEGLVKKEHFMDVMASLRAIAFFHRPPQPVLDIFFLVATNRLVNYCRRLSQKSLGVYLSNKEKRLAGLAALHLLQNVFQMRKTKHQRMVSRAVQRSLLLLEENCRRAALYRQDASDTSATSVHPSTDLWSSFSPRNLADLLQALQEQQLCFSEKNRNHRRHIKLLYGRLLSSFARQMKAAASATSLNGSTSSPRSMYYALLPLCAPGHLFDISPQLFLRKSMMSLLDVLSPQSPGYEKLSLLSASALLYGLSFRSSRETVSYARGTEKLKGIFDHLIGQPELSFLEAAVVLRSAVVLEIPENEALIKRVTEVLVSAQLLSLASAVDILLTLAQRRKCNVWESSCESLAVRATQAICAGFSRRGTGGPSYGKQKLVQIYRLLTAGESVLVQAFAEMDNTESVIKKAVIELICQAVSVVAKSYYDHRNSRSLSLSSLHLRRIRMCLEGSARRGKSGVLPSEVYEICEAWK